VPDEREREWIPEDEFEDRYVERARAELGALINSRPNDIFYERQLQVLLERKFYHWITSRALDGLAKDGDIRSEFIPLIVADRSEVGDGVRVRFFFSKKLRYWMRKAKEILELVKVYSDPTFSRALGRHCEMLFDAGLARGKFMPVGENVSSFEGKEWEDSGHNLDRIYERDGIAYGAEVKNKLAYIDRQEMEIKLRMCRHLGLRPLFIVRAMPKSWVWDVVQEWRGYCLVFQYQLYPFGYERLAKEVRERLRLPADCPRAISEVTVRRFLDWHIKSLGSHVNLD